MAEIKVLIVDGEVSSRNYLAGLLSKKQCRVLGTSLGKEGLIFAWRDHPDLIVIDPRLADLPGEQLLRKLRLDARTQSIPAIAFSSDPNPRRRDACLKAGFNEYLVKSSDNFPVLMNAIERWLVVIEEESPQEKKKKGLLITFLSAKGGTGASSLCANLAMSVHRQKKSNARVAVLDSVLPIGSIASIVGYDGKMNLVTLAALPPEETNEAFFRENLPNLPAWGFRLVAGSPDPESAGSLRGERIARIVEKLQAAYDYVFIDIGRSLSNIILPLILKANLVALVISADLGAVQLSRLVLQYLRVKGLPGGHIYPILNRVVGFEGVTKTEVENLLGLPIQVTIPHLSGNFSLANNQHVPLALKFPGDSSAMILKETAAQMMELAGRLQSESPRNRKIG